MFGANVRRVREAMGLTQGELAERAGLHQITISNIETGRASNPEMDTVRRLAKALKVKPSALVDGSP